MHAVSCPRPREALDAPAGTEPLDAAEIDAARGTPLWPFIRHEAPAGDAALLRDRYEGGAT